MIEFTIPEIKKIINGKMFAPGGFGEQKITRVATDSRTFFMGDNTLFFALKGPRNNGHDFIPGLIQRGMKVFVVSEEKTITPGAAFILVKDTTNALQQFAASYRRRYNYPVTGITGSNGKTIVKEWLHELLAKQYKIVRSPKSYNSQIGVPLSVLLMDSNFNLGIFEAGISQPGEMQQLEKIIKPHVGILTNIGDAHQENFISKEQKTTEKLQLFKHAEKLIFCTDNDKTSGIIRQFCRENPIKEISWTLQKKDALIRFEKHKNNGTTKITAYLPDNKYHFSIPFTDRSAIENACHCFAAAYTLLNDPESILPAFEQLSPIAMRLEIKQGINNCLLINDYYNSDLASLTIALTVLHQQAKKGHLKKQVILSDIQQTGIQKDELYRQVNQLFEQWKIDTITGIGSEISANAKAFSADRYFYTGTEAFCKNFKSNYFADSVILIKGARAFTFEKISSLLQQKAHQTVLEINMNALVDNLNIFRSLLEPSAKIMVMVKAFSYGSGDVEIAKLLQFQNVDYMAVAVADEGIELRQAGINTPIIVMNPEEHSFQNMIDYLLEPNIYSFDLLKQFEKSVAQNGMREFPVHLKTDTGMNRLGFKSSEEILDIMPLLSANNRLKIKTVFSHLAASDDPAFDAFTHKQIEMFENFCQKITDRLPYKPERHILNSAGIERFPGKQYEMVRLGIGLYGISVTGLPLQNISTLKSTVSQVKKVYPGETVGYGRQGEINENREIAVVPVGYADGMDRRLGNYKGNAFIKGKKVPITGNICMDMLMIDVTGMDVRPEEEVELFGSNISVSEVAEKAGTIPYEILTGISQRVKRIYIYE